MSAGNVRVRTGAGPVVNVESSKTCSRLRPRAANRHPIYASSVFLYKYCLHVTTRPLGRPTAVCDAGQTPLPNIDWRRVHEAGCGSASSAASAEARISTTLRTGSKPVPPGEISTSQRPNALILSAPGARPKNWMFSASNSMRLAPASSTSSPFIKPTISAAETEP